MEVGLRVVRGPDWKWEDQDGGEGSVGTVMIIGRSGSLSSPDKTVIVQWDVGTRTNYRCGYGNAYDLSLLDNGPVGVVHGVSCNECQQQTIEGIRWQCADCSESNLCSTCYHGDKHSLKHHFCRINSPSSLPVCIGARQGQQKVLAKGTYTNAIVVRGPDWDWGNQDGGPNKKGVVTAVKGWDTETFNSVVSVTWDQNTNNVYRRGHKGKVDVQAVTPADGGYYYKEHLPKLGSQGTMSRSPGRDLQEAEAVKTQFKIGDKVRILLDVDVLKSLQREYGRWDNRMKEAIGVEGSVLSSSSHGVVVKFLISQRYVNMVINPLALSKVQSLNTNDTISILNNYELVKKLQACHGEWTDSMKNILGKEGKVQKIYSDGDIQVRIGSTLWTMNPAVLIKINKTAITHPQVTHTQAVPSTSSTSSAAEALPSQLENIKLPATDLSTKLILAAGQGQYTKVKEILAAEPNKVNESQKGKTALHVSCHQGHVDVAKLLLKTGAVSNIKDNEGDTPLHYAAFGNKPLVATALIQHGANVNSLNNNKLTSLHISVNKGHENMVKTLIDAGCDVDIQDSLGDTALHSSITLHRPEIFNLLLTSNKCNLSIVNRQGFNVFHRAALKGRLQALSTLLIKSPALLNSVKDDGFTALHLAALNGHLGLVEVLLAQAGCEVNTGNQNHQTALLLAADKKHSEIVRVLLQHNADPNIQDDVGDTPLHVAAYNHSNHGNTGDTSCAIIMKLLVEHRADTQLRNHDDKTPADLCNDEEMSLWLRTAANSSSEQRPLPAAPTTSSVQATAAATCNVTEGTTNQCRLCDKPVDCKFEPCGDSVVCFACSHMFKACILCKEQVESVTKFDDATLKECVVCEDLVANVIFEPCLHQVVCSECCIRMKKCPECRQVIVNKKNTDDTTNRPEEQKYGFNMDSLVYLQAKVQEMEEEQICAICMDNKRNVVFLCGHSTCSECCQSLRECHMCRKPIEKKIQLFS